jgi:DNA-binding Lrp family transcriptional regulator
MAVEKWSEFDRRLLARLESGLPLVARPFEQLADHLGVPVASVLSAVRRLRGPGGIIREISGILDPARLGYEQALVALAVPEATLDRAGQLAAGHPGVSHAYARCGPVNLWLTLAVSTTSRLGLVGTVQRLARQAGATRTLILPAQQRWKLHVRWMAEQAGPSAPPHTPAPPETPAPANIQITDSLARAVRALQQDLPAERAPFDRLSAKVGLAPADLLNEASRLAEGGILRRYAAVLRHRRAGAACNLLVAWELRDASAAREATLACPAVSHVVLRPPADDWPYRLYTMIHAADPAGCQAVVDQLASGDGLDNRIELWTRNEYAKRRARLLTDHEARWEDALP